MLTLNYILDAMSERQRKIFDLTITSFLVGILVWAFLSFFNGEIVFNLFANDPASFQKYLFNLGSWAPITYTASIILEVLVAFIPGWFIYPAGGAIFGVIQTVLLVLLGNFIGASISFWIGKRWGLSLLQNFISAKHVNNWRNFMERHGVWSIFLLKLNPVTSLDIWNYLAGASPISYWKFTLANLAGITPLVIVSSLIGDSIYEVAPQILGILILMAAIYIVWFVVSLPHKFKKT